MKQDFLNYIRDTFKFSLSEMMDFENALSKPLKKTIRVNTNKISVEDFMKHTQKNTGTLAPTPLGYNMFYIDREDTSCALGHTLEHISGYFYSQELAASSSPFYMSGDKQDRGEYMILDMSASPGGKTTQLAEYYPKSTILANEIDKTRMKQLYENTDRLGAKNVFVTNYDGRFFQNYPETFDKILLDAPCSGEGTAYKTDVALKYWNIKNIKRIAKLQLQLLESALMSLKVGGELVYSTCTLNRLENEEIIEKILEKYTGSVEILHLKDTQSGILSPLEEKGAAKQTIASSSPLGEKNCDEVYTEEKPFIRSWPHKTGTGGFFVAKLRKTSPFPKNTKNKTKLQKHTQGFEKLSNTDEKIVKHFFQDMFGYELVGRLYTYRNEIYFTEKNIDFLWENFFLYKCGIKIGKLEQGVFSPNYYAGVHFGVFPKNTLELPKEDISKLLRGESIAISSLSIPSFPLKSERGELQDGYYQVSQENILAGLVKVKNAQMESLLETKFMQK